MSNGFQYAYVGCRTSRERNARGDGITIYAIHPGGEWEQIQLVGELVNPSWLGFDRTGRMLYAVHGDGTEISAFAIDRGNGRLAAVNRASTQGKNPVHLVVDSTNRFIVIANHLTVDPYVSNLAVLALRPDGSLGDLVDLVPLIGQPGPHRVEQAFAKPHQCVLDPADRFISVPDKGLDVVHTFRLDEGGKLHRIAGAPAASREGEGPRHMAFHPALPYAYVLNELSSTVMACRYDPNSGTLTPIQEVSSLPDSFISFSRASEIELSGDGRFAYASNRGHDSIGTFAVDAATGRLAAVGWTESGGKTPRFFTIDPSGKCLFVANEDSDTIVRFDRDAEGGTLTNLTIVAGTGSPTSIVLSAG